MVSKIDIKTPLLAHACCPHEVECESLAAAGELTMQQAQWLQRALVFHGVCAGRRDDAAHRVVDLRPLPTVLRALDVSRHPLNRAQREGVRTFLTRVHTAARAVPASPPVAAHPCDDGPALPRPHGDIAYKG